jgi:UTP--glucose-1-phosphate uridylyltransferase
MINHLTPDQKFINLLSERNSSVDKRFIKILNRNYRKFNNSEILWINQKNPMGFGDALLSSKKFVGNNSFLLHAGDTYIPNYDFLKEFVLQFKNSKNAMGTLLLQKMKKIQGLGLANVKKIKNENVVFDVEEKPQNPKSNLGILPIYLFKPKIFDALMNTDLGHNNELQVTDAIKTLIKSNKKILSYNYGLKKWFDIGIPENYFKAFTSSYKESKI